MKDFAFFFFYKFQQSLIHFNKFNDSIQNFDLSNDQFKILIQNTIHFDLLSSKFNSIKNSIKILWQNLIKILWQNSIWKIIQYYDFPLNLIKKFIQNFEIGWVQLNKIFIQLGNAGIDQATWSYIYFWWPLHSINLTRWCTRWYKLYEKHTLVL